MKNINKLLVFAALISCIGCGEYAYHITEPTKIIETNTVETQVVETINHVEFVAPCEYAKEYLLFDSENYYSYYRAGNKEYIGRLDIGVSYQTTDGTGCRFKILEDLSIEEI